jgi:hypothetical protein
LRPQFKETFGDDPKREDLTILAAREDDAEDLVRRGWRTLRARRRNKPLRL